MLLLLLSFALPFAACLPSPHHQQPLQLISSDKAPDLSADLFRSVHGLLKSWSQAFQPIGRNIVPAIIPTGTLLYHGRGDAHPPTSGLEWFALDAEHAYMFASRGPDSTFNTYVATKPLKVLYFDGFSASKGNPGSQDLQRLVAFGAPSDGSDRDDGRPRFEDGRIAEGLCQWGARHGIQGFVREEATFEVIWCDFGRSVRLLHSVNTTRSDGGDFGPPGPPPSGNSLAGPSNIQGQAGSGSSFPAPRRASQWPLLNAASWHYSSRDSRVLMSTKHLTSLSDEIYTSLWPIYHLPVHERKLVNISKEDAETFKASLEENIKQWHHSTYHHTNFDYLGTIDVVVDRTAGRLARMRTAFALNTPSEAVERVKSEALDILFPYLDVPLTLWDGDKRPNARTRHNAIQAAAKSCGTAYTSFLRADTSSEKLIVASIEGVLHRICAVTAGIVEESLSMQVRVMSDGVRARYQRKTLEAWQEKVVNLMNWLDWPVWQTCKTPCELDEICYMPMWPVHMDDMGGPGRPTPGMPNTPRPIEEPRCVKRS